MINEHVEPGFNTAGKIRGMLPVWVMIFLVSVVSKEWIYTARSGDNLWNLN